MYYKVLNADGTSPFAHAAWSLPDGDRPGEWMPAIAGTLVKCERGYHAVPLAHLARRLFAGACVYEVEIDTGDTLVYDDEVVARRMRLVRLVGVATRRALVSWACDCAERALPIYERRYPDDGRVRACVETARRYLDGHATPAELQVVRVAAAHAAVRADAAAAHAAYAARDAAAAAWDAVGAAYAAAREQERAWQRQRLLEHMAEEVTP